ncbi:hypothetical protein PR202_ga08148 [Eleusine coracana subsp. coracana]|uniref:Uncharacterized protein n=1 Tax=Eleusine coracana subsp. coracana TaxID=191504 RepID=A0AAV5BZA0_ELECO|nr:hypothetical protein PR202_ga08148 [Eleusine coracana subsp. coracana]
MSGTPAVAPDGTAGTSFTAGATTSSLMLTGSGSKPDSRAASHFFLHLLVPAGDEGEEDVGVDAEIEEEEPEEVEMATTSSSSPSPPRRNVRIRIGGRGRPSASMASRAADPEPLTPPGAPDFNVLVVAEPAGSGEAGEMPTPHNLNGGRLLHRHAHVASTPPRRPGREAGAWAATARVGPHSNGVLHEEDSPSR